MYQSELSEVRFKHRVARGMMVMGGKRLVVQVLLTVTNIILARLLAPEIFGAFAILTFVILVFSLMTTFGLPPALVQKQTSPNKEELRAVFTLLLGAALVVMTFLVVVAPLMNILYRGALGKEGIFWLRLYALQLIFLNTAGVSGALLERKLAYRKLALAELTTLLLIQGLTIILALKGLGVGSFVLGSLIGRITGFFVYFILSPWPIGLKFSLKKIRPLFAFGLDFQFNSLISAFNTAVVPGLVGALTGPAAVGLVNWAGGVRQAALAPMDVVEKMIFPAAARTQNNKLVLKKLVEKMLEIAGMFSFPLLAALFALAPEMTRIIFTPLWLPGVTALYLSLIQGVFIVINSILIQVLFALGRTKEVRNITLIWALMQWVLTVPLIVLWNFNGVVLAGVIVSATVFLPLRLIKREVDISVWPKVLPYLLYACLSGLIMFVLARLWTIDALPELVAVGLAGAFTYWGLLFLVQGNRLLDNLAGLKKSVLT